MAINSRKLCVLATWAEFTLYSYKLTHCGYFTGLYQYQYIFKLDSIKHKTATQSIRVKKSSVHVK